MGDYVGIHPEGARDLIGAMNQAKNLVTEEFMADVKHQLCVAQSDAVLEAQASYVVYQQYRTFLDTYAKDLKWRIEVITGAPDAEIKGEMVYGTTQFASAKAAAEQGTKDGEEFKKLWEEAQESGDFTALLAYLESHKSQLSDPAYAEAFLNAVGGENIQDFIDRALPVATGPDPLGPLFTAIATVMNTGRAPEVTATLMKMLDNESISWLIQTQDLSDDALFAAANVLLKRNPHLFEKDYLWLIEKLGNRPAVLQRLLSDADNVKMLFADYKVEDDAYRAALISALRSGLVQGTGDPVLLSQAMGTLIQVSSASPEIVDLMAEHEDLATALTERFLPYLEYAGYLQASEYAKNKGGFGELPLPDGPQLPVGVTPKMIQDFLGGAIVHENLATMLGQKAGELMANSPLHDLFEKHGYDYSKIDLDSSFNDEALTHFGVFGIIMGARYSGQSDINRKHADEKTQRDLWIGFVTGLVTGAIPGVGVVSGAVLGSAAGAAGSALGDWLAGQPEDITPEKIIAKYQELYIAELTSELTANGMDQEDAEELAAEMGAYLGALEAEALKAQNDMN